MGFKEIERVKGVHHTTVLNWVKQVGELLPNAYEPAIVPEVGELDELETFIGKKKENLALDSSKSLQTRNLRLGFGRPQCRNV